eukprot:7354465-Lingulodinium_polyedra.AAC.1
MRALVGHPPEDELDERLWRVPATHEMAGLVLVDTALLQTPQLVEHQQHVALAGANPPRGN